jgi:1-acyl-sn-glycerol-3-phosphate acyltransferase
MGRFISKFLLWIAGWKYIGPVPTDDKYVIISVPHTSMWDFVWGKLAFASKRVHPIVFIKQESFFFPLKYLLHCLGARPVNRGPKAASLVDQMLDYFNRNKKFCICITPEGTRGKVNKWKKGFYFISQKADVPIYLGIIDYGTKTLQIGQKFIPTGDIQKDMEFINQHYRKANPKPKYPDQFTFDFS